VVNNYYGYTANKAFTAYGGSGNDSFDGSSKNDTLYGEKGRDRIHGANGADTLSGGKNADTFYYYVTTESGVGKGKRDYITDFKAGEDKLYFQEKSDTNSGFTDAHFGGKSKVFDGTIGEIIWHTQNKAGTANDRTFVQMDFDGDRVADLQIELKGLIKLSAGDFIL
jgi:Ca2+-binding RTX toxin-like protein